jgi:hypothetical protein
MPCSPNNLSTAKRTMYAPLTLLNRYEPTGNAAWGGMGQVNECEDKNLSLKWTPELGPGIAEVKV